MARVVIFAELVLVTRGFLDKFIGAESFAAPDVTVGMVEINEQATD